MIMEDDSTSEARFANSTWYRNFATSASIRGGLLLVGGYAAPWTSELISEQGKSSETFVPNPGRSYHCSIQVSKNIALLYVILLFLFV